MNNQKMAENLKQVEGFLAEFWNNHLDLWGDEAMIHMDTLTRVRQNLEGEEVQAVEPTRPVEEPVTLEPYRDDVPF